MDRKLLSFVKNLSHKQKVERKKELLQKRQQKQSCKIARIPVDFKQ